MHSDADNPQDYLASLPAERREVVTRLHEVIEANLQGGFETGMGYGMLSYHVPLSRYPAGYHCDPKLPVPFMNLASQKNYVAVYHSALYMKDIDAWFREEHQRICGRKADMGKCCIRFKRIDDIPYDLIGQLTAKVSLDEWLDYYQRQIPKKATTGKTKAKAKTKTKTKAKAKA